MNKKILATLLASVVAAGLTACGNDDDAAPAPAPTPQPQTVTGVLLDAAVQGVDYATPTGSGTTDTKGQFSCKEGEKISFSIGGITLGSVSCATTVTPQDLAAAAAIGEDAVINRLLFLQTLDQDGNPANGIQIPADVKAAFAGKALDFKGDATAFATALAAILPTTADAFGVPYNARPLDATARKLALEHFQNSLVSSGVSADSRVTQASAGGEVVITKYEVAADASLFVPYEGSSAKVKADFPGGFYPAAGSGLAFKGKAADGSLEFWGLTDRGPNGDGPNVPSPADPTKTVTSKIFPTPNFHPSVGLISVGSKGATLKSLLPLADASGKPLTGLPISASAVVVGGTAEAALDDSLKVIANGYDANGIDPEAIVISPDGKNWWISDEYGPFLSKFDMATGRLVKKYQPGSGASDLPLILSKRRVNRGMEGLTLDKASGKLYGMLQSPIDDGKATPPGGSADNIRNVAKFARWLEFDPTTETSKLFAYPINGADYDKDRTGNAKMSDLVSLGNGKFIVVEQGSAKDGTVHNRLMLVEIPAGATNIAGLGSDLEKSSITTAPVNAADYSTVVTLKKTQLLDLNAAGWLAEKAEGLSIVDDNTLALINDNDFGLRTIMFDAQGNTIDGDITACTADAQGVIIKDCPAGVIGARVTRGLPEQRPTRLWLIRFPKKLSEFAVAN
ncbi:esterase-like activity of phytase family protein [Niveibacterium sp. SC-1]|uniref:esterase-like activity of phytase family protein n=1 Tax=Niveibacterium sp. SC-1 TaxID=3135646 RepID=UPI0031205113